ncbi:hypothetical protein ES319_A13G193000v1 [Gossypium barbadense]|uniref:Major facilitator superfamily (MFS) profile domain-containing protein n=2 Tax=Gossypium TaxID=3633 RepID=A0A5J5T1U4_GOSBA|nr:hypothetical protein ES319_A13G193000v1 [Gossypium barbadense]TYG87327.1 hypothetical protein ES288_A13G205500v1 [Gossypium darwinii]
MSWVSLWLSLWIHNNNRGMAGAIVSEKISDFFGHKITFWILNIFYIMGWLAIVFAQEAWSLYVGRLSLGFGTAVFNYGPVYVADITPKNLRGGFSSLVPVNL